MSGKPSVTASEIKKGQRVRVVLEGEVDWAGNEYLILGRGGRGNAIYRDAEHVVSVEVLPDPEPKWQRGDVVLDDLGRVFVRLGEGGLPWRYLYEGARLGVSTLEVSDDFPARPLTLLVRDGKPVTS